MSLLILNKGVAFFMKKIDCARIKETVASLQKSQRQIFGADSHGFRFNPSLSAAKVATFEQIHKITLPEDYRQFLTCVGNGGAGPFYGIFPLGKIDDNFGLRDWKEDDSLVGILSKPFLLRGEWNDLSSMPSDELANQNESEYWRQMEAFEKVYWGNELVNGAIPICHEGCALRIWLVVTGTQAGYLWEDKRSELEGLIPLRMADGTQATFESWYDDWLNECLARS
jgi:hypothetical protein